MFNDLKKEILDHLVKIRGLFIDSNEINTELADVYFKYISLDFLSLFKLVERDIEKYKNDLMNKFESLSKERTDAIDYVKLSIAIDVMIMKYLESDQVDVSFLTSQLIANYYALSKNIIYKIQSVDVMMEIQSKKNSQAGRQKGKRNEELKVEYYDDIKAYRERNRFLSLTRCAGEIKDNLEIPLTEPNIIEVIKQVDNEINNLR